MQFINFYAVSEHLTGFFFRKRYVYRFNCQDDCPSINTPLTIDYSGAYFRRDGFGGSFIGGLSPLPEEEPSVENLDVDYTYFDEKVWPILAKRIPAFNGIKVNNLNLSQYW